ncbi:DEAD/DEAH box helicase family protein [Streptomyces sp. NPDC055632]
MPLQGARGTIVSATGSGKTVTAAACALESFADDRILVTVPIAALLNLDHGQIDREQDYYSLSTVLSQSGLPADWTPAS